MLIRLSQRGHVSRLERGRFEKMSDEICQVSAYESVTRAGMEWVLGVLRGWLGRVVRVGYEVVDVHEPGHVGDSKDVAGVDGVDVGQQQQQPPSASSSCGKDSNAELNQLLAQKHRKKIFQTASHLFSTASPAKSFAYLHAQGIIPDVSPESMARVCHDVPGLDKKKLGEFLGKLANVAVLKAYMDLFRWDVHATTTSSSSSSAKQQVWKRPRIDEALRVVLERFRLPGEAQQIERVVESFSAGYFEHCVKAEVDEYVRCLKLHLVATGAPVPETLDLKKLPKETGAIQSDSLSYVYEEGEAPPLHADTVFVLAYAVIMLNTDQHNPQVRKRMARDDFIKNLRGTNQGKHFCRRYLENVYDAIKQREIVMPDEHEGDLGFEFLLKETASRFLRRGDDVDVQVSNEWLSQFQKHVQGQMEQQHPDLLSPNDVPVSGSDAKDKHAADERPLVSLDREMYLQSWKVISSAILYLFHSCDSPAMLQQSVEAYRHLCALAFYYARRDILDQLLVAMFKATKLVRRADLRTVYVSSTLAQQSGGTPLTMQKSAGITENEGDAPSAQVREYLEREKELEAMDGYALKKKRGEFLKWFKSNIYAQISTMVAFKNLSEFGDGARDAWIYAADVIQTLYDYDIMTPTLLDVLDYSYPAPYEVHMPRIPVPSLTRKPKQTASSSSTSSGFFSALSSFLLSGPQEEETRSRKYVPTEEERDAERACVEVVLELRLDRLLFEKSAYLSDRSFKYFISGLCRGSVFKVQQQNEPGIERQSRTEMEQAIFILDTLVKILEWNTKRVPLVYSYIREIIVDIVLKQPSQWHYLLVKRAISGWFRVAELLTDGTAIGNATAEKVRNEHLGTMAILEESLLAVSPDAGGKKEVNLATGLAPNVAFLPHLAPLCLASLDHFLGHILEKNTDKEYASQLILGPIWPAVVSLITAGSQHVELPNQNSTKPVNPGSPTSSVAVPPGSHWAWECFLKVANLLEIDDPSAEAPSSSKLNGLIYGDVVEMVNEFIRSSAIGIAGAGESTISASSVASKLASATGTATRSLDRPPKLPAVQNAAAEEELNNSISSATPRSRQTPLSTSVERALISLKMLYRLYGRLGMLIDEEHSWSTLWLPVVVGLGEHTYHPAREVRQHAFTYIQRVLLSAELMEPSAGESVESRISLVFGQVLFPLMDTLLLPEVSSLDQQQQQQSVPIDDTVSKPRVSIGSVGGTPRKQWSEASMSLTLSRGATIDEVRIRACALLCKMFLHFLPVFESQHMSEVVEDVWVKILSVLERYWRSGKESQLENSSLGQFDASLVEAIPESLKNMLLVMSTSGVFGGEDGRLWDLTWIKLEKWLPGVRDELFPESADEKSSASLPKMPSDTPQEDTVQKPNDQLVV